MTYNVAYKHAHRRTYERTSSVNAFLKALIVIVLIVGMVMIFSVLARHISVNREISENRSRITELSARADNLNRNISDRHNLEEIAYRAVELGMVKPDESQKRIVTVRTNAVYSVCNTEG